MDHSASPSASNQVRAFSRAWTEVIGLLDQGLLQTEFSLPQARVLYELNQQPTWELRALRDRLGIDKSFLTRVVSGLTDADLVEVRTSATDGRSKRVELTDRGREEAAVLEERSAGQIEELLGSLTSVQQAEVTGAMTLILGALGRLQEPVISTRELALGDVGWVTMMHGELYGHEYGWNHEIETLAARVMADFCEANPPAGSRSGRERAFIAEVNGARAGSLLLMEADASTAQIRLVLASSWARGLGIGRRLVDEAIDYSRTAGYEKISLWTNDVLSHARRIYQDAGFTLLGSEDHHSFGTDLTGQTWELQLLAEPA